MFEAFEDKNKIIKKLEELVPAELKKDVEDKKLEYSRYWVITMITIFTLQQIANLLLRDNVIGLVLHVLHWTFTIAIYALVFMSLRKKKMHVIKYGHALVILRIYIAIFQTSDIF